MRFIHVINKIWPRLVLWLLLVHVFTANGKTEEFQVGFGRSKITPTESVWMSGYAGRRQGFQAVLDDLYVQTMAVQDAYGTRALLLRLDVCILRDATVTQICDLIRERTGLMRRQILVNVSHTHSGPAVDELYHYPMSTEHRERLAAYMERLKATCAEAAYAAIQDLSEAHLEYGKGEAHFFHNRRGLDEAGRYTGMMANPENHTDRDVPVLKISGPEGEMRGVVYGVACHCVTLGVNYEISADYAGHARMLLEKEIPHALFVTGCGADANPHSGDDGHKQVQQHGRALADEIKTVLSGPLKRVRGPLQTEFRYVDLPLVSYASRDDIERMRQGPYADIGTTDKLLALLNRGARIPQSYAAPFSVWQFGSDLSWIGLPEEAVSEYVPLLQETLKDKSLWISGYCNDVSGYLPTRTIMKQGGYETRGLISDTEAGWFAPAVESVLLEEVSLMVDEAKVKVGRSRQATMAETFKEFRFEEESPFTNFSVKGVVEKSDRGILLDGESYLEMPHLKLLECKTKGLTVAAWVRPTQACMTENRMIICQWANQIEQDCFGFALDHGRPSVGVGDGIRGEVGFTCDTQLPVDTWTFVATTWFPETRQYRIYIDGKLASTMGAQTGSGLNQRSQVTLKIGAQASEGHPRYFIGGIDDIWIGNGLNPAAIRELYEEQRRRFSKSKAP